MESESMKEPNSKTVGVDFDQADFRRIERQAKRSYSGVRGAIQSYIRLATLKALQEDEKSEEGLASKIGTLS